MSTQNESLLLNIFNKQRQVRGTEESSCCSKPHRKNIKNGIQVSQMLSGLYNIVKGLVLAAENMKMTVPSFSISIFPLKPQFLITGLEREFTLASSFKQSCFVIFYPGCWLLSPCLLSGLSQLAAGRSHCPIPRHFEL